MIIKYATYPLRDITFFNSALHTYHASLVFEFNNEFRELYFDTDGKIHECVNRHQRGGRHIHDVGETSMSYEEAKDLLTKNFDNMLYVFGKRDCWSVIEFYCRHQNIDISTLGGPISERKQHGNGIRHIARQAEGAWMNFRRTLGW
jgi:hypothetical protein